MSGDALEERQLEDEGSDATSGFYLGDSSQYGTRSIRVSNDFGRFLPTTPTADQSRAIQIWNAADFVSLAQMPQYMQAYLMRRRIGNNDIFHIFKFCVLNGFSPARLRHLLENSHFYEFTERDLANLEDRYARRDLIFNTYYDLVLGKVENAPPPAVQES